MRLLYRVLVALLLVLACVANADQELAWDPNADPDLLGYNVWCCEDPEDTTTCFRVDDPTTNEITTTANCYPLTAADFGYYFRLTALNLDLYESAFTDPVLFDTVLPCMGDFDCDGDVDGSDVYEFKQHYGRSMLKNPCPTDETNPYCSQ